MFYNQNYNQYKCCQQQVFDGAVVCRTAAAAKGTDTNGNQRQTDGQYNSTCNNRREKSAQGFQEKSQYAFHQTTNNRCTHNGTIGNHTAAHIGNYAVKYADKAGTCPHDNRNFPSDRANGKKLKQCYQTRNQHGILQQTDLQIRKFTANTQAASPCDDQQWCQVPYKHGKYMLQSQGNCLTQRHFSFKGICRSR